MNDQLQHVDMRCVTTLHVRQNIHLSAIAKTMRLCLIVR